MTLSRKDVVKAGLSGLKTGLVVSYVTQNVDPMRGALVAAGASLAAEPIADMVGLDRNLSPVVAGGVAFGAGNVNAVGLRANSMQGLLTYSALVAACEWSSGTIYNLLGLKF